MATPPGTRGTAQSTGSHRPQTLTGARVVLPTGTLPGGRVTVTGAKITSVARHGTGQDPTESPHPFDMLDVLDVSGHWLVPGFVDLHNHGGGGASFAGSAEDVLTAVRTHRAHGTTTLVASTVTDDMDGIHKSRFPKCPQC